jgi:hypothetical protein
MTYSLSKHFGYENMSIQALTTITNFSTEEMQCTTKMTQSRITMYHFIWVSQTIGWFDHFVIIPTDICFFTCHPNLCLSPYIFLCGISMECLYVLFNNCVYLHKSGHLWEQISIRCGRISWSHLKVICNLRQLNHSWCILNFEVF